MDLHLASRGSERRGKEDLALLISPFFFSLIPVNTFRCMRWVQHGGGMTLCLS